MDGRNESTRAILFYFWTAIFVDWTGCNWIPYYYITSIMIKCKLGTINYTLLCNGRWRIYEFSRREWKIVNLIYVEVYVFMHY